MTTSYEIDEPLSEVELELLDSVLSRKTYRVRPVITKHSTPTDMLAAAAQLCRDAFAKIDTDTIRAAGEAEAKAMSDKADALAKYGEAATRQMLLDKAPEIARALSEPLASVRDLSIISTEGASALPKAVAGNVEQLNAVMRSLTGSDLTDMLGRFIDDKGDKKPGV